MSCHYSCASCSNPIYLYNCTSCVSTRQLIGSLCYCSTGYSQQQQPQCIQTQNDTISQLGSFFSVLYFVNIGLFWTYVMFAMCRVNLPKVRLIIIFGQLLSLIQYFPFYQQQVTQKALRALDAFNFEYLGNFRCTKTGLPTQCTQFENIIAPIAALPIFIVASILSFFIMNVCYGNLLESPISFGSYIRKSWFLCIYNYIDMSVVAWSLGMSRVIIGTDLGYIVMAFFILLVLIVMIKFYRILNSKEQITHLYRTQNNWAYIYDQSYHLYYIDYLYEQQSEDNESPDLIKSFIPHSNFMILQLIFRLLIGASTVILFYYKPALFGVSAAFLFLVGIIYFGTFRSYHNWDLIAYILAVIVYQFAVMLFWLQWFWVIAVGSTIIGSLLIIVNLGVLFAVKVRMNQQQINKVFQEESQQDRNPRQYTNDEAIIEQPQNNHHRTIGGEQNQNMLKMTQTISDDPSSISESELKNQQEPSLLHPNEVHTNPNKTLSRPIINDQAIQLNKIKPVK